MKDRAWLIVVLLGVLLLIVARGARAHEPYSSWMQPDNPSVSCCSGKDCKPTRAELREDGWWAVVGGKWTPVPWSKVLPTDLAGDGRSHVCENAGFIYCFSPASPRG